MHFPIAFLSLASGLDLLYGAATFESTSKTVASIYNVTPFLGDIAKASHFANVLGLLTAIPAIFTGIGELLALIKSNETQATAKRGDKKAVSKSTNPKLGYGIAHAVVNEIAVIISVYNWWSRRNNTGLVPDSINILLSGLVLPGLLAAAFLGGILVYDHGVGVMRQEAAKKTKGQ